MKNDEVELMKKLLEVVSEASRLKAERDTLLAEVLWLRKQVEESRA